MIIHSNHNKFSLKSISLLSPHKIRSKASRISSENCIRGNLFNDDLSDRLTRIIWYARTRYKSCTVKTIYTWTRGNPWNNASVRFSDALWYMNAWWIVFNASKENARLIGGGGDDNSFRSNSMNVMKLTDPRLSLIHDFYRF